MFEIDGVELEFTDDALEAVADQAILRGTGARGLRAIMEEVLLPVMFDVPSRDDIARVRRLPRGRAGERQPDPRAAREGRAAQARAPREVRLTPTRSRPADSRAACRASAGSRRVHRSAGGMPSPPRPRGSARTGEPGLLLAPQDTRRACSRHPSGSPTSSRCGKRASAHRSRRASLSGRDHAPGRAVSRGARAVGSTASAHPQVPVEVGGPTPEQHRRPEHRRWSRRGAGEDLLVAAPALAAAPGLDRGPAGPPGRDARSAAGGARRRGGAARSSGDAATP